MSRKTLSILVAASIAAIPLTSRAAVDGQVAGGEYPDGARALQGTAPAWGDNQNEIDGLYANFTPNALVIPPPSLQFALTGNLDGNGYVFFIDAKSGGGVAQSVNGGRNRFGSMGGERTDDWGTDIDGGDIVTSPSGGASVVSGGFNPEKSLEIGKFGTTYYIHVIDMTQPNDSTHPDKDVWLNQISNGTPINDAMAASQVYNRSDGPAGVVTHYFDTTNAAGVTGDPDNLGDPTTAVKGFEALLDPTFLGYEKGKALRVYVALTNGSGDYLSNQFLPKLHYANSGVLAGPGGWGSYDGGPLVDVTTDAFQGDSFVTLFEPTFATTTDNKWSTASNWAGNFAPNGVEHDAAFLGAGGTVALDLNATVGYLKFNASTGGYTITAPGAQTLTINAGSASGRIDVGAYSNTIGPKVVIASDTRINLGVADLTFNAMDNSAGKRITIAGAGTVNINGAQTNGVGAGIAVDSGTVNINTDGGSASVRNQQIFVGGTVNFSVSQHLDQLGVNPGGVVTLAPNGGTHIVVANQLFGSTGGKLNIGDGKLLLKNTPAGTWNQSANTYEGVTALIASGRGTSNLWDGGGIVTTQTGAVGSNYNSIGIATASDVRPATATATAIWAGETITGTDTLVMYTYGGDATLDGKINVDDYIKIDSGIAAGLTGWVNGDFNYDGKVTIDDYITVIDANIGNQNGVFPTGGGVDGGASGVTAVPEPATLSLLALGALGAMRRRRRSS